jgi:zinc transport system substrate-binding protein
LLTRKRDPHFWLDPTRMSRAVDRIARAAAAADPKHAASMRADAARYRRDLAQLDTDFAAGLANCARKEIVTAHAAFGYLAARYGLTQEAVTGISPDAEPSPRRLAQLSTLIKRDRVTTVFFEKLVPRDFADTLAHDAGVTTALLDPVEALTKQEYNSDDTYLTVMRRNLAALRAALDCKS